MHKPQNLTNLLIYIYPKEILMHVQSGVQANMIIGETFMKAKHWKHVRSSSVEK